MSELKQSTATTRMVWMASSTDHVTGATGLTLTCTASKAGGAFAGISPTVTERGSGWYALAYTASHTDTLGDLAVHVTATGADPTDKLYVVVADLPGVAQTGDAYVVAAAVKLKTDNLPSDPADASDVAASFSTVNATLATIAGYIDTEVAAIKAKTDGLPSDPADASDVAASFSAISATLATIAAYIDTEVAAIKAKTDNLPASPAAVGSAMTLSASGLDGVAVESGLNARQSLSVIAAALGGLLSGAGTATITIKGAGVATTRISATVDEDGNRSAVVLSPPA